MSRIITIGRQFGSGGREIGRRLAERLGIAYYDKEIVTEIAKRTDLAEEYIRHVEERQPQPIIPLSIGRSFSLTVDPLIDQQQSVFIEQSNVIREMAAKSDCIIVGRCADYILREEKPLRLFFYADLASRIERCRKVGELGTDLSDKEMGKKILAIDKSRSQYYRYYTEQEWGDKSSYDLMINTTNISVENAVEAIIKVLK